MSRTASKITLLGVCTATAMVLSYIETLIPASVAIPGIKIGLANVVAVFLLMKLDWKHAAAVSAVRVLLTSLLFGNFASLAYSAAGAFLSMLVMSLLKSRDRFSTVGISTAGGVAHNAGQILMAIVLTGTKQIAYWMPPLILSGTLTGVAIGGLGALLISRIKLKEG